MPITRLATIDDVLAFDGFKKLIITKEEAINLVTKGILQYQETIFSDEGEDYTKLISNGKVIGYWAGF